MTELAGVLGEIVARKRVDVAARFVGTSLEALRAQAVPTRLSLAEALARPGARFVMEVKKASPSAGLLAAVDPAAQAAAYAGAATRERAYTADFGRFAADLRQSGGLRGAAGQGLHPRSAPGSRAAAPRPMRCCEAVGADYVEAR